MAYQGSVSIKYLFNLILIIFVLQKLYDNAFVYNKMLILINFLNLIFKVHGYITICHLGLFTIVDLYFGRNSVFN